LKITEQDIIDLFALKNKVFSDKELRHIDKLTTTLGLTVKKVIEEEKFKHFCSDFFENTLNIPYIPNENAEKLIKALNLNTTKTKTNLTDQLYEYWIFYVEYFQIFAYDSPSYDKILVQSKLELTRKNLPLYKKIKNVDEDIRTFNMTKNLDLFKLNKWLKLNFEHSVVSALVEKENFKPFLRYNANIGSAFNNKKVNDDKIDFLGSLFELKKFVELLIENKLIDECDNTSTKISKIFLVRGKEISPAQLIKPNGKEDRISLLKHIIENSKKLK
jgi:hypothetical protein